MSVSCLHEIGQASAPSQRERERLAREQLWRYHEGTDNVVHAGKCTVDRVGKRVATGHVMRHTVCCVSSVHRQRVELTFGPRRDEREERREVAWSVLNADEKSAGKKISFLKLGKGMTRATRPHTHSHTCTQTLCLVAVIL